MWWEVSFEFGVNVVEENSLADDEKVRAKRASWSDSAGLLFLIAGIPV